MLAGDHSAMQPPRGAAGCESCLPDTLGSPGGPGSCLFCAAPGTGLGAPQALSSGPLVGRFGHQVRPLSHCSPVWKVVGDPGFLVQRQLYPLSLGLPVHAPPRPVHTCWQRRFEDVGRRQGLDLGPFICTPFPLPERCLSSSVWAVCTWCIYIYIYICS